MDGCVIRSHSGPHSLCNPGDTRLFAESCHSAEAGAYPADFLPVLPCDESCGRHLLLLLRSGTASGTGGRTPAAESKAGKGTKRASAKSAKSTKAAYAVQRKHHGIHYPPDRCLRVLLPRRRKAGTPALPRKRSHLVSYHGAVPGIHHPADVKAGQSNLPDYHLTSEQPAASGDSHADTLCYVGSLCSPAWSNLRRTFRSA